MTCSEVPKDSAQYLLIKTLRQLLLSEFPQTQIRLFVRDLSEEDHLEHFVGLASARWALFEDQERAESPLPTIVVGLLPMPNPTAVDDLGNSWLEALLNWRGFVYLPYGFNKADLIVTVRHLIQGARDPLPAELLPTPADVLRVTSEVRHWLDNRRQNVERALDDFGRAERGESSLHRSYLEPVSAISEAHQRMLSRLWALEPAALRFAPATGGLAPMKAAVVDFEARWKVMESKRAAITLDCVREDVRPLSAMMDALKSVHQAIENAISTSRALDVDIDVRLKKAMR